MKDILESLKMNNSYNERKKELEDFRIFKNNIYNNLIWYVRKCKLE